MVTFRFSATVFDVDFDTGTPSEFVVGDSMTGTYTFDSAAVEGLLEEDDHSEFAMTGLDFSVGTYSPSSFISGIIHVRDAVATDIYDPEILFLGPDVLGLTPLALVLFLSDPTASGFSSDALPLEPPNLNDFSGTIRLFFGEGLQDTGEVSATVDSLLLVPSLSPMNLAVLGSFMGLVGWRRLQSQAPADASG